MSELSLDAATVPTSAKSVALVARADAAASADASMISRADRLKVSAAMLRQRRLLTIVGQHQANSHAEVFSSIYTGLELAVCCATTQLESGGQNIYGSDPAADWMNHGPHGRLWGAPVTKKNYAWFLVGVAHGEPSNGVGPKQLTSPSLLAAADARGGAWDPQHNCAEGDVYFKALLAESGTVWAAAYHYNGSGAAAIDYANRFVAIVAEWRVRLA